MMLVTIVCAGVFSGTGSGLSNVTLSNVRPVKERGKIPFAFAIPS